MIGAALGALTLSTLVLGAPAQAKPGDPVWTANGESAITGKHEVTLKGGNTSVETANLNMEIAALTTISFHYELSDGAVCGGGAPRVFVMVAGVNTNSWDQLIGGDTQCGEDGDVSFTIATPGTIKEAGVVYDNGTAGTVVVSDLRIGDELVDFRARETGPPTTKPTPKPTVKPTKPSPTPTETSAAPAAPAPGGGGGSGLPVTGASGSTLAGIGLGSLLLGTGALFAMRRRTARFTA